MSALPPVNAALNGLATLLLVGGFVLIKLGRRDAHQRAMLSAFVASMAFLACYLTYHAALHFHTGSGHVAYSGAGLLKALYLAILISHVTLAAAVPVLALVTIYRAWKGDWPRHRRMAKVTFPIWLYVSVTGVIIYVMLYHLPAGI